MKLQLGWKAGTEQYGPSELLEYGIAAEESGFDSIEASDHFHPWSEKGQACFVWTWLGAVAARTRNIMLGTGVTCPIFRYHPAVVAQAAAIPGAQVLRDAGGVEAARFQAATSGQTLLYSAEGDLLFNGGITSARGHAGDNFGKSAIISLVNGGRAEHAETPVFGCTLESCHPQNLRGDS